jgi:hypothetical protein
VRKIAATAPKHESRDRGGENQAAASKPIFVQMFAGEKGLLYVVMLHHLKRTQNPESKIILSLHRYFIFIIIIIILVQYSWQRGLSSSSTLESPQQHLLHYSKFNLKT